jgi:hypothetical protein
MSQTEVLKILYELGGEATLVEIKKRAKEKFPSATLHTYVIDRLKKLQKWGNVDYIFDKKRAIHVWKITKSGRVLLKKMILSRISFIVWN